ncbi:MAG: hypothetical protein ACTSQP_14335 [Promethearchaeota archaeon]
MLEKDQNLFLKNIFMIFFLLEPQFYIDLDPPYSEFCREEELKILRVFSFNQILIYAFLTISLLSLIVLLILKDTSITNDIDLIFIIEPFNVKMTNQISEYL